MNAIRLTVSAAVLLAGCSSGPSIEGPSIAPESSVGMKQVTLFVPGMNRQLKIL